MIMTDTHNPTPSKPLNDLHGRVCSAGAPFARLQLGKNIYEIANAIADTEMLAFRGDGCRTWTALDRRQSDGWARLGADILLADPDSYYDFLQTHAVRVSGDSRKGEAVHFDTLGHKWSVRLEDRGRCLLEFGDGEWSEVDLGERAPADLRERSILALMKSGCGFENRVRKDYEQWAERIAMGVQVQPVI